MRYSKQREMILQTLKDNPVHPTADYIYDLLKPKMRALSLGTVYRNLNLLEKNGLIKRIRGLDGRDRFDHNNFDHLHTICQACGRAQDVMLPPKLAAALARLKEKTPFTVKSCEILLNGICAGCREQFNRRSKK